MSALSCRVRRILPTCQQTEVDSESALGFICCICGALCYARAKHLPPDRPGPSCFSMAIGHRAKSVPPPRKVSVPFKMPSQLRQRLRRREKHSAGRVALNISDAATKQYHLLTLMVDQHEGPRSTSCASGTCLCPAGLNQARRKKETLILAMRLPRTPTHARLFFGASVVTVIRNCESWQGSVCCWLCCCCYRRCRCDAAPQGLRAYHHIELVGALKKRVIHDMRPTIRLSLCE